MAGAKKHAGNPNWTKGKSGNPHGRPKGVGNKINQEIREKALAGGISPLEYMLAVMRDKKADVSRRDDMAKASAPYLHARLQAMDFRSSLEVSGELTLVDRLNRGRERVERGIGDGSGT